MFVDRDTIEDGNRNTYQLLYNVLFVQVKEILNGPRCLVGLAQLDKRTIRLMFRVFVPGNRNDSYRRKIMVSCEKMYIEGTGVKGLVPRIIIRFPAVELFRADKTFDKIGLVLATDCDESSGSHTFWTARIIDRLKRPFLERTQSSCLPKHGCDLSMNGDIIPQCESEPRCSFITTMTGMNAVKELDLLGVIAFDGRARNGLRQHPNGEHLLYPIGEKIVVKNMSSGEQSFLTGHRTFVSAIGISPCGKFVASGQANHHGFKATVIVWDYEKRTIKDSYEIHKGRVEDVCFTRNSEYLISLGGKDDGNLVVWDVRGSGPVCGAYAGNETSGSAFTVVRTNVYPWGFVTAGDRTLKIWRIDPASRRLHGVDVKVGKIRRAIECLVIDENDENAYCGTSTGDILKARLHLCEGEGIERKVPIMIDCYSKLPRTSREVNSTDGLYAGGVKGLLRLSCGRMVVATGEGIVELIEITNGANDSKGMPVLSRIVTCRATNVCASVTSLVLHGEKYVLVGTVRSEIHEIKLSNFHARVLTTCHVGPIHDLAFPRNHSEIFATAGENDVRLWTLKTQRELLRISVPNFACSSLRFDRSGQTIVTAWNDGTIRGFACRDGKLAYTIHNAHAKAVSAVAITDDGTKLVSGGCDGQVRIWDAKSEARRLMKILKEHRGPITSLSVSRDDRNLISSSTDGTCVVWDLTCFSRKYTLMGNTMYAAAVFSLNDAQILTCGTDRRVAYWETWDGTLVREIEGSGTGTLNAIEPSPGTRFFITGGSDCIVKLWDYRTAITIRVGFAHGAAITACKFSPDGKCIVSASADGAIVIWDCSSETTKFSA